MRISSLSVNCNVYKRKCWWLLSMQRLLPSLTRTKDWMWACVTNLLQLQSRVVSHICIGNVLSRPEGSVTYKEIWGFGLKAGIILHWPLTILNYNLQWHSRQISLTVYIALSLFHTVRLYFSQSVGHYLNALSPLSQLFFTRPLIPASKGGRYLSWIPELSPYRLRLLNEAVIVEKQLNCTQSTGHGGSKIKISLIVISMSSACLVPYERTNVCICYIQHKISKLLKLPVILLISEKDIPSNLSHF
jgi:hypothetical protein